ncbi:hypothetical protein GALMADRAFT_457773 [Galerina marginata CBS 339.88]|uniref:Uncharacterized protein n=1 Tax=Galerina marginata (strain CBS 339.88) TaxID=685588 RepID=A0A067SYR3_GALM3|nr:hypothetical protein GALMADRAFT_457773 [Galerina marginata CBS 339.88]
MSSAAAEMQRSLLIALVLGSTIIQCLLRILRQWKQGIQVTAVRTPDRWKDDVGLWGLHLLEYKG